MVQSTTGRGLVYPPIAPPCSRGQVLDRPAPITEPSGTTQGPPPWWPALRSHIERADRAIFDLYPGAYEFDRAPLPGELWPGQTPEGAVVRVRRAGDQLERRLVLRDVVEVGR